MISAIHKFSRGVTGNPFLFKDGLKALDLPQKDDNAILGILSPSDMRYEILKDSVVMNICCV